MASNMTDLPLGSPTRSDGMVNDSWDASQLRADGRDSLDRSSLRSTSPSSTDSIDSTDSLASVMSDESDDLSNVRLFARTVKVSSENITVEEVREDDFVSDGNIEVLQPDGYEDPDSDSGPDKTFKSLWEESKGKADIIRGVEEMCTKGFGDVEEQERRYRQKKKRWSAGLCKRSHSQSIESDSDPEDEDLDAHDIGCSARRLRRRVKGPGDRSSLVFEDSHPDAKVAEEDESHDFATAQTSPGSAQTTAYVVWNHQRILHPIRCASNAMVSSSPSKLF